MDGAGRQRETSMIKRNSLRGIRKRTFYDNAPWEIALPRLARSSDNVIIHNVLESTSSFGFSHLRYTTISQSPPNLVLRVRNSQVHRYLYQSLDRIIGLDNRTSVTSNHRCCCSTLTFLCIERQANSKYSLQPQSHRTPSCR